jgi:DNA-binding CsgD family transcriptional regulator
MKADAITVLEEAYRLNVERSDWLGTLARVARDCLAPGQGFFAYEFHLGRYDPEIGAASLVDLGSLVAVDVDVALFESLLTTAPADLNFVLGRTACSTMSRQIAEATPRSARNRKYQARLDQSDVIGLVGVNPDGAGACLCVHLDRQTRLTDRVEAQWTCVGAHLAAALRLRQVLSPEALLPSRFQPEDGEAVLAPDGRVEHAEGVARTTQGRARLREAALSVDRARSRLRRDDPFDAMALWRGLVAGRWSLIDHFDSDGRRYYVALRNDPKVGSPRALSDRERQVVAFASQGHSDKLIAYELGLSRSTVAMALASARRKLGARTRSELIRLSRDPEPA